MDGWGMQYDSGLTPFWDYRAFKRLTEKNWDYYGLSKSFGRSVAFFANATYSYKGRYTITGTTRYEGTNRLGRTRKARWLPTWNISGAWNAHSEDFFEKQHLLSHLTLKGSYSLVGVAPSWSPTPASSSIAAPPGDPRQDSRRTVTTSVASRTKTSPMRRSMS